MVTAPAVTVPPPAPTPAPGPAIQASALPPPASPATPPAAVAPFRLVPFGRDRADLTLEAREAVREAAQEARRLPANRIEVDGHTDRSGDAAYNIRLAQRRAESVAAELARNGLDRTSMVVRAHGETRPVVPTADGVREARNNRVEITLLR